MISECLNRVLGEREKKRLTEFEKQKYAELNNTILKDDGQHRLTLETESILK